MYAVVYKVLGECIMETFNVKAECLSLAMLAFRKEHIVRYDHVARVYDVVNQTTAVDVTAAARKMAPSLF